MQIEFLVAYVKGAFEKQKEGAKILLKKVPNPSSFGVPKLDGEKVIGIEEKPEHPETDCAVIGIYMYDSRVFDIISTLERSDRGELEITDVNNAYIKNGTMTCSVLDGWWIDAGSSPEHLAEATQLVIKNGANNLK